MASCTYNKGLNGNPYAVLTVTQKSQDKANNKSVLAWDLKIYRPYNIQSSASKAYSVTINGTKVKSGTTTIGGSGTKTIASGEVTVPHNSDGNKTVNFSFSLTFDITWSGTPIKTGIASGSITLTRIPRASSISSVTGDTIGSSVTVKITPADESFTHKLLYYPAGRTTATTLTVDETNNQCIFTPSISDCDYIPNATSGTAKLTLETYSGTTKIGTVDKTFTLKVPDTVKPTVSLSVAEAVSLVSEKIGAYVKGLSKLKITPSGSGKYKSTIKSYKITVNGATYNPAVSSPTITTGLLQSSGTLTIKAQVTDSRGRVGEATTTVNVLDYKKPYIDSFTVARCDENGNLSDEGTYVKVTVKGGITDLKVGGTSKNTASYRVYFKKTTASSYMSIAYVGATSTTTYLDGSTSMLMSGFDTESGYNMYFEIKDLFNDITKADNLSTAFTLVDYYKDGKGIAFGKVATETGIAEFNLKIKANKGIIYPEIPINTDFNDLKTTGVYKSLNNKATTYVNCPVTVGTFLLEIYEGGNEGQIFQRLTCTSKTNPIVYERFYFQNEWSKDWVKVYGTTVLWSGAYYMQASHTIALKEAISKQPTGIVLVFSRYDTENGAILDDDFSSHFVSKNLIADMLGKGHSFFMSDAFFRNVGAKYLTINDTQISGHAANVEITTSSGITFNNKKWVLRYVLGV